MPRRHPGNAPPPPPPNLSASPQLSSTRCSPAGTSNRLPPPPKSAAPPPPPTRKFAASFAVFTSPPPHPPPDSLEVPLRQRPCGLSKQVDLFLFEQTLDSQRVTLFLDSDFPGSTAPAVLEPKNESIR